MPNEIIRITAEEFNSLRLINNNVAVEITHHNAEEKTNSGIVIVQDVNAFTVNSVENAENYDVSQHLDRFGTVAKIPDKLNFVKKGKQSNLDANKCEWGTEIEIHVGDLVWADYYNLSMCPIFKVEDKEYWIIGYQCLIAAKRFIHKKQFNSIINDENYLSEIIPLNGYCLFEQINEGLQSKFLKLDEKINKQKGIVRYTGSLNKEYYSKKRVGISVGYPSDDIDIKPGDEVIFRNETELLLENPQHRHFEDCNLRYEQRWGLQGVIIK
jgi:co-chaperonin GroES (HSP10)